jgi:succinylglutamate desuccinylase
MSNPTTKGGKVGALVYDRAALADLRARRRTNATTPLKRVAITGGTHGNETTGVFVMRHFINEPEVVARNSFETLTIMTNPGAIEANARYVDVDLNRCFLLNDLLIEEVNTKEEKRARELNELLGPKSSVDPAADLIIDLHNTTANTGVALMLPADDEFAVELGSYLQSFDPTVRMVCWTPVAATLTGDWGLLPSIGRSGMTFEVGATPWGAVNPKKYEQSRTLLLAALDYVEMHNTMLTRSSDKVHRNKEVTAYIYKGVKYMYYPTAGKEDRTPTAIVHPLLQDRDFEELLDGDPLYMELDGSTIPFYRKDYDIPSSRPLYPFFINEAAYYEGGVSMILAIREERKVAVWDMTESVKSRI